MKILSNKTKTQNIVLLTIITVALLWCFALLCCFETNAAHADVVTEPDSKISFVLYANNTAYKVKVRDKTISEVVIPDTYNDLPVTAVADNGFMGCSNLVMITLPTSITLIGNNAFYNCKNLETVRGLAKVRSIGNNAFANCVKLSEMILPPVESLGKQIFKGNPNRIYARMSEDGMAELNPNWADGMVYGSIWRCYCNKLSR